MVRTSTFHVGNTGSIPVGVTMRTPENGFYYHYKHDPAGPIENYAYEVFGFARHSEDESVYVMYRPLYENSYFEGVDASIRPLECSLRA